MAEHTEVTLNQIICFNGDARNIQISSANKSVHISSYSDTELDITEVQSELQGKVEELKTILGNQLGDLMREIQNLSQKLEGAIIHEREVTIQHIKELQDTIEEVNTRGIENQTRNTKQFSNLQYQIECIRQQQVIYQSEMEQLQTAQAFKSNVQYTELRVLLNNQTTSYFELQHRNQMLEIQMTKLSETTNRLKKIHLQNKTLELSDQELDKYRYCSFQVYPDEEPID